ncbi:MAG TPA: hypothetical protein V6C69_12325 [Trichormus sp.]|jgi:hypothetical protein
MTSEAAPNLIPSVSTDLTPMKKKLDLLNVRGQMSLGLVAMLVLCFATYWQSFSLPLSAYDYSVIQACRNAVCNPSHLFLDNSTVYDLSLSIVSLFATGHSQYRVFNVFVLFVACAALSLIVLEITGRFGNRVGAAPAIWAGLFFAVCPWHAYDVLKFQSDLLAVTLQLLAIFCFLRFQGLRERAYYLWAIAFGFLAIFCHKDTWTTPFVVTILMLLVPAPSQAGFLQRSRLLLPFWAINVCFLLRFMFTLVPNPSGRLVAALPALLIQPLIPALDPRLTISVAERFPSEIYTLALEGIAVSLAVRLLVRSASLRTAACIALWVNVQDSMSFGSLPFESTAPVCAAIALMALPAIDSSSKRFFVANCVIGSLLLLVMLAFWAVANRYSPLI